MKVSGNYSATTTIIATGTIKVSGNSMLQSSVDNLVLISKDDIDLVGNGSITGAVYSEEGKVKLTGNKSVSGCLCGKQQIEMNGNTTGLDIFPPEPPILYQPASPTNDPSVDMSGLAEAYSTVEILEDVNIVAATAAGEAGAFAATAAFPEGSHSLNAVATDSAGNISALSTTRIVAIDTTIPDTIAEVVPPAPNGNDNWYVTTPTITLTATDNLSGVADRYWFLDSSQPTAYQEPISIPEGIHTLHYYSTDKAGNIEVEKTISFKVDTQAPTVSITSPEDQATISGIVDITATASDNLAIDRVEFYIDDQLVSTLISELYTYSWDTSGLSGEHTIKVTAYDTAGNSESDIHTVTVAGNIITPEGGTFYSSDKNMVLEFPPGAVSETIEIVYTPQTAIDVPGFTYTSHFFTLEVFNQAGQPVTQFAQPVQITVQNVDPLYIPGISLYYQDGQTSEWIIIQSSMLNNNVVANLDHLSLFALLSDTIAPTTSVNLSGTLGSNNYYTSDVMVTLDATDAGSGVEKTEYSLDGGTTWNIYSTPFAITAEGTTSVQARSTDNVGNTEDTPVTQVVNIDKTQPSIIGESPTEPIQVYRPIISADISDTTSGIDSSSINMKLDGSTVSSTYDPISGGVTFVPPVDLAQGKHTIMLTVQDLAGNLTTSSWSFVVFGTPVSGTISTNTKWTKDNGPYIAGNVTVNSGVTLTIEPGTIIKFNNSRLTIRGTLIANGTPSDKIIFTSIKDDSYGGDTNNDGSATTPASNDWYAIDFVGGSGSQVTNSVIKYAGKLHDIWISGNTYVYEMTGAICICSSASPTIINNTISKSVNGIHVHASSPMIRENIIKENQQKGLYFQYANYSVVQGNTITDNGTDGIAFYRLSGLPVINQNAITGNQRGIYSHDTNGQVSSDITNNTFTNNSSYALYLDAAWSPNISGNTASGNGTNGICITSTNKGNATWHAGDLPYISNSAIVDAGTTLTIEPGTIIKFYQSDLRVEGTLIANGTPQDKIIFTSIKDDSHGGDTNNDGSSTLSARGDWKAIHFAPSTISCVLNNCIIKYGGKYFRTFYEGSMTDIDIQSNIYFRSSSPTVSNCIITDSLYEGITGSISSATIMSNMVTDNSGIGILLRYCYSPVIEGNTIKDNIGDGLHCSDRNAAPLINHNDIWGNSGKDLIDYSPDTTDPVNAEYNWWGSAVNPGSKISGSLVDYDPWALSPYSAGIGGADAEGRYGSNTPCGYSGEPVNTALGNFVYEHEDINIPGKGLPLQIARSYNSLDTVYNGPLGYAWTFNYNISLRFNADESITVMREDGKRHIYSKNPDESYTPPGGVQDTLTKNPDGTYTLTLKGQTKYNFASSGRLTSQVDKNGNTTGFAYDSDGKLITATDPGGRTITFTYTGTRITKIQDQTGRNVQYGYNASGDLTSVTDLSGYVTTFTYNSEHQLLTMREPEPSINPFLSNHYTDGRVDYQYDAFMSQNLWSYDTVNHKITCTDNKGAHTTHEYDESNRLAKTVDPSNHSTISGYSTFDQPDYITNQNGKTTCFSYDANGNTISTKDPLNHEVTASYDLSNNNLLWTKDALLRQITYNYDPTGINLMSITSPIGTTSFTYYSDGLLNTTTDANSHTTGFDYNAYGNLTSITDPLIKTTTFEYDSVGRMSASIDANGYKTQFVYDNLGNITTIKDPLAISDPGVRHQVDFTYDGNGNQKTFRDANNNLTSFDYDDMDNLISVTDANNKTTSYTYDANYNLDTVTDPLLHTITYDYDGNNRLWKITDPLTNVLEFNYDPVGNLTKTIYPNSNETNYSYYDDGSTSLTTGNLLHTITYNNEPTSYTYTYNPTHTISSVTDNNGKVNSYQYDDGDRLIVATDHTNPAHLTGFIVNRGYDGVSNLTSLTYAGDTYTYGYNQRDDLTSLISPSGTTTFSYDDARNRTDVDTSDGTNRHYTYNEANRIIGVTNSTTSGTQSFTYTHDGNGNILTENSTSYTYDPLNRLTSWAIGGITTTYDYDDAGNLLSVEENGTPIKSFTYNAANQISSTGFSYDENGNFRSDGNFNYVYDGENRLKKVTKVSDGSTVAEYTYDYLGRRTSKTVGGTAIYYHYDGWNVVAETDSAGATTATYSYDNRNQLVSMTGAGQTYYYQYNAHGDVVSLTNSSGNVVNSYEYDPWGKILSETETVENPYRYAGYRYDSETELYYLQHRYYDPEIFRFLTGEPQSGNLMQPQSLNSFVYCSDNPTGKVDQTGRWGNDIHYLKTHQWAEQVGLNRQADAIATANMAADQLFKSRGNGCSFLVDKSHHVNMLPIPYPTSNEYWALFYLQKARLTGETKYLGYGLHSLQDEIAHSRIPFAGLHIFGIIGFNPDTYKGLGREKATELVTKMYLELYTQTR